ncbi:MAG: hypothetical protein GY915_05240, partial [bacterium]|nr:hypothetical protein [bacterium]
PRNGLNYPWVPGYYGRVSTVMLPSGYQPKESHALLGASFMNASGPGGIQILEKLLGIPEAHASKGLSSLQNGGLEAFLVTCGVTTTGALSSEVLKGVIKRQPVALALTAGLALDTMFNNGEFTKSLTKLTGKALRATQNAMDVVGWVTQDQGFAGFDLDRLQDFITDGVVGEPTLETFPEEDGNINIKLTTPVLDEGEIRDSIILMQVTQEDIEFADSAGIGDMKPGRGGKGVRWESHKKHKIRVMPGDPDADHECQREDYVKIVRDGQMRDVDGDIVESTKEFPKPTNNPDSHIQKTDWLKWAHPLHPTDPTGGVK